jgi:hypothetical protein
VVELEDFPDRFVECEGLRAANLDRAVQRIAERHLGHGVRYVVGRS